MAERVRVATRTAAAAHASEEFVASPAEHLTDRVSYHSLVCSRRGRASKGAGCTRLPARSSRCAGAPPAHKDTTIRRRGGVLVTPSLSTAASASTSRPPRSAMAATPRFSGPTTTLVLPKKFSTLPCVSKRPHLDVVRSKDVGSLPCSRVGVSRRAEAQGTLAGYDLEPLPLPDEIHGWLSMTAI